MRLALFALALALCGCDCGKDDANPKPELRFVDPFVLQTEALKSTDEMVPLSGYRFSKNHDRYIEIATLNELREIKKELRKMNAAKEGKESRKGGQP